MEPTVVMVLNSDQDHTLTWLLYQLCLKLNMEYGYLTNVLLYDITKFLSSDTNRFYLDIGILTCLFYYLWKGKIDLEAKSKFSYKILLTSASYSFIILKWDLDMFLWVFIFTIVICFFLADLVMFIARILQYGMSKIILVLFLMYVFL